MLKNYTQEQIKHICLTNSFKIANREYGIDYKTYLSYHPALINSIKTNNNNNG